MSLREQMATDTNLFFSLEDFAQMHVFAGRKIPLLVDKSQLQQYALKGLPGLVEGDNLIYAKAVDVQGLALKPGVPVVLDGVQYIITAAKEEDGIFEIALGRVGA